MSEPLSERDAGSTPVEAQLGFEQALAQLEHLAAELEAGQLGLTEALARYERGIGLLRRCQELLAAAERRIELLVSVDAHGQPRVAPVPDTSGETLDEKAANRGQRRGAGRRSKSPPEPRGELFDEPF